MKRYLFILLVPFIFACGNGNKEVNFVTYSKDNYSIEYPEDWTVDTDTVKGYTFKISVPPEDEGAWSENINLYITDFPSEDLQEFMYNTEAELKEYLTDSEIYISHIQKDSLGEYYEVGYSGSTAVRKSKWKSRSWMKNKKAYVLTYTATPESFDKYLPEMDKAMASFKFNE